MHIQPAELVGDTLWTGLLLLLEFRVNFILRNINEFTVIDQLFDVIIHWSNKTRQQLVDAAINLILLEQDTEK